MILKFCAGPFIEMLNGPTPDASLTLSWSSSFPRRTVSQLWLRLALISPNAGCRSPLSHRRTRGDETTAFLRHFEVTLSGRSISEPQSKSGSLWKWIVFPSSENDQRADHDVAEYHFPTYRGVMTLHLASWESGLGL